MKVLLLNGSANKNGNTFTALSEIARQLEKNGVESEIMQLGNKPVRGCIACGQCQAKQLGHCVFDDDICNRIVEKLNEADALIVGSPVYYGQPNGAVMAVLQRAFFSGAQVQNKPAAGGGRPSMLFRTFFEKHPELDGKTIIPFGTHGGSGVGSYATLIKEYFHNATVLESLGIAGVSIRDASSRQTVENWLKKLGVDKQSTAINNVRTRSVDNSVSYSLNGMRSNGQRGIQIRNGNKYIKQ